MGFTQLKSDPCIYVSGGGDPFYIGVYVDDMFLVGKDTARMKSVKQQLSSKFDIKNLGKLSYFLGMSIVQNVEERRTWMGQSKYMEKLLTKMGMGDCKVVKTPVDHGSLMYLTTCTRPDIAYAVGMLARYSSKPNQTHWVVCCDT